MNATVATALPPALPRSKYDRRNAATLKLLFIAGLVLALHVPLYLINSLRVERAHNRGIEVTEATVTSENVARPAASPAIGSTLPAAEGYRITERALKHSVLVLSLVFAAFFLFEVAADLRLHAVHYGLVGAAMCLFYLALLALGEVATPDVAYAIAAVATSLLITLYSVAILHSRGRAGIIAALLASVFGALYLVLRMEDYALLAGTAALFAALAAVMYFTRNVDWHARDAGPDAIG
jgi:inner membrane protein